MSSAPAAGEAVTAMMGPTRRWGHRADGTDLSLGTVQHIPSLDRAWGRAQISLATAPDLLLELGRYPTTQGTHDLLEALGELWAREGGAAADPSRFVLCHGALDGCTHALAGLAPGSPVAYALPGFDFGLAVGRCGLAPRRIPLGLDFTAEEFLDSVGRHLRAPVPPAAVIASFPTNPGGRSASPDQFARLVAMTARAGARLVVDDVYRCADGRRDLEVLEADHVVVVDSLSKRAGAPGLRLGWARCNPALVPLVRGSVARSTVGVASPVVRLAIAFFRQYLDDQGIADDVRREIERRRLAARAVAERWPEAQLTVPEVGLFAWAPLRAGATGEETKRRLADAGVRAAVVVAETGPVRAALRLCFTATADAGPVVEAAIQSVADLLGAGVQADRVPRGEATDRRSSHHRHRRRRPRRAGRRHRRQAGRVRSPGGREGE